MTARTRIGIIGVGNISRLYIPRLKNFEFIEVAAVADIDPDRATEQATAFGVRAAPSVEELLADPTLELVVNLTIPAAHAEVSRAALNSGKSVFSEKPLAVERSDGADLLALAADRGVLLGGAPDTFLGAGLQTCRGLLDRGTIGRPIAAAATFTTRGPEGWHPNPAFYYTRGAGPLFDMGPYYLTALVALMGPFRRVLASSHQALPERLVTSQPLAGMVIRPDVPTHVSAILELESGARATLTTTFDVWASRAPAIELYGTAGSMVAPDPNTFGGPVRTWTAIEKKWRTRRVTHDYPEQSRGLGVADMVAALRTGRPHRASGELTFHVLDTMHTVLESAEAGTWLDVTSTCAQPEPLPPGAFAGLV